MGLFREVGSSISVAFQRRPRVDINRFDTYERNLRKSKTKTNPGMFGPFRASFVSLGGRLNKIPWRLSDTRKANVRKRIKAVDSVIESIVKSGVKCQALTSAISMPKHSEMRSVNKYFVFARNHTGLKKGVHKVPKFTKTPLPRAFPAGIKRKYI